MEPAGGAAEEEGVERERGGKRGGRGLFAFFISASTAM